MADEMPDRIWAKVDDRFAIVTDTDFPGGSPYLAVTPAREVAEELVEALEWLTMCAQSTETMMRPDAALSRACDRAELALAKARGGSHE